MAGEQDTAICRVCMHDGRSLGKRLVQRVATRNEDAVAKHAATRTIHRNIVVIAIIILIIIIIPFAIANADTPIPQSRNYRRTEPNNNSDDNGMRPVSAIAIQISGSRSHARRIPTSVAQGRMRSAFGAETRDPSQMPTLLLLCLQMFGYIAVVAARYWLCCLAGRSDLCGCRRLRGVAPHLDHPR